jgi:hypothetical protein
VSCLLGFDATDATEPMLEQSLEQSNIEIGHTAQFFIHLLLVDAGLIVLAFWDVFAKSTFAIKTRILFFYPCIAGYSPEEENSQSEKRCYQIDFRPLLVVIHKFSGLSHFGACQTT